ncbi:MAG TPA: methanogenesis marker 2 protein [Candidatus Syntrophoarchaeum butanivorans]|uniref:Methanogenesis marker 2 protein n=1 Tax=Candidatus Syntropharchaeum butanivorans TaxID=1839936 RepID=A0A1F2P3V6_9EURY|nr:MAG: methanogenesis marker protein 2 [Candidatus Syntrophoarchaeum butanivorans]HEC57027.1 methanogenesis marker 2 protein [Candidatus Syntrophoarchaeum butanivorans]
MEFDLDKIVREIRSFEGITRKNPIGSILEEFNTEMISSPDIEATFGEDAAVISHGDDLLLIAADGIWERLMNADPRWAGYCAVLVNIHDIAAMGGKPVGMVDVLSFNSKKTCTLVIEGMRDAVKKFDVPILGGHLHPDTPYNILDIAILGIAKKGCVILSNSAEAGDVIIMACDLEGRVHPSSNLNWDSTTLRDKDVLKEQINAMRVLGEAHLVHAGKDISNPGLLGTIGMMIEVSGKGAIVDMRRIPKPEGVDMIQWLKMYPGMGFVVAAEERHTSKVIEVFEDHYLSAAEIGVVEEGTIFSITDGEKTVKLFDFSQDRITGIKG